LGLLLAYLLLPYFNHISAKSLSIPWTSWWLAPVIISGALIVGLIAGLYPAYYLSGFRPIQVLKGQLSRGSKNSALRNVLVVFQFATSIILIIGTIVIYGQMQFILHKKIGFDKDQVMLLQGTNTLENKIKTFKDELLKSSQIKNVSVSDYLPISNTKRDGNTFYKEGRTKLDFGVGAQKWVIDCDYIKTMGMEIVEGRNFSKDIASDSAAVIINQSMAAKLGLKNPIGERITNGWGQPLTVIGVLKDFNFETMKQEVSPLCFILGDYNASIVAVKINAADVKNVIGYIGSVWKSFSPNQPIRYTFLDESFANMYDDVKRTGSIFTSFSVLAIVIACLGLFALSAFMAEQRNKEMSIRKVLGASISQVTTLLSRDFVRLVLIAFVIASPIAWWAMNKWLQDFAYRITISGWVFLWAGLTVLIIALATISFQAIKAALANPAESLRTE
jgi:putative ABC transport system permease protein